ELGHPRAAVEVVDRVDGGHRGVLPRREAAVGVVGGGQGPPELLEVVRTLHPVGGPTGLLDGGQGAAGEDGDDGNDHQQLDQGEAGPGRSGSATHGDLAEQAVSSRARRPGAASGRGAGTALVLSQEAGERKGNWMPARGGRICWEKAPRRPGRRRSRRPPEWLPLPGGRRWTPSACSSSAASRRCPSP